MKPFSRRARRLLPALFIAFGASFQALAADEPPDCSSIVDDASRLACYDRHFGSLRSPLNGAQAGADTGRMADHRPEKKVFTFTSKVTALDRRRDGQFVATLENGQAWEQSEINSRAEVRVGDSITIRRGALGSYLLTTAAGIGTRVKRLR